MKPITMEELEKAYLQLKNVKLHRGSLIEFLNLDESPEERKHRKMIDEIYYQICKRWSRFTTIKNFKN